MKTVNTTATTTVDFALSSIAMAVKSAKVSMKEAQKEVDATSVLPVYDAKREAATKKVLIPYQQGSLFRLYPLFFLL